MQFSTLFFQITMEKLYDDQMSDALAELNLEDQINYSATASRYNVSRQTLSRQHKGKSTSHKVVNVTVRQALSGIQEVKLVERISAHSIQGWPMTPQVVRDLAERIAGRPLGECWTRHFVQHHSDELKSVFLKPIDKQHK